MKRVLVAGAVPEPSSLEQYRKGIPGCDVDLLVSVPAGWPETVIAHSANCREYYIPRGECYADCYDPSASGDPHLIALARSAGRDEFLRRVFVRLSAHADVIVYTTAVLFDIDGTCGVAGKHRIYAPDGDPEYLRACGYEPVSPDSHAAFPVYALESRLLAACNQLEVREPERRELFYRWYDSPSSAGGSTPRRHLILVNDYPLDHTGGGGHVRMRELYGGACCDRLQITLVCFTDAPTRRDTALAPHFHQIAIPKDLAHRNLQGRVDSLHSNSAADITSLVCSPDNAELHAEFRAALVTADLVVFEHVYMAPLEALVAPDIAVVYGAQNVETELKASIYADHPLHSTLNDAVQMSEEAMVNRATAIVCVSPEDATHFRRRTDRPVHVVENGVRFDSNWQDTEARDGVAFIGSGHGPNIEAVRFLLTEVAPKLPETSFRILGSVSAALDGIIASGVTVPPNVTFTGVVSSDTKDKLLRSSAVGVNPVFSGSGSNLKLPEYFSARLPVLSTPFGARGFAVSDRVHLRIADGGIFAEVLGQMLLHPEEQQPLVNAAWQYAKERLSWSNLGRRMGELLLQMIDVGREQTLVLTDRRTSVLADGGSGREASFNATPRFVPDIPAPYTDYASSDAAMRSRISTSPELARFVSLYHRVIGNAVASGDERSAVRQVVRLLASSGVSVSLVDGAPDNSTSKKES